jgi:hypothetical protein
MASEWQPIETAPKDGTPIVAWCVHDADPYILDNKTLTTYGAHAEGLCRAEDGYNIVIWGGEYSDVGFNDEPYTIPPWWFVLDTEFERAANPTHWMPLPEPPK